MGATQGRLIKQLFVESFLLVLVSCALGYLLAYVGLKGMVAVIPPDTIPSEAAITLSPIALLFSLGATALTAVICGLAPAFHSVRRDLQSALTSSGKGASADFRHGRLRFFLVIVEVALSIALLIGSGLMMRTLLALEKVNIGFDPAKVLYARLSLPEGQYISAEQKKLLFQKILDRIALIPGVIAAAGTTSSPPYTWGWTTVAVSGKTPPLNRNTAFIMCTESYFKHWTDTCYAGVCFHGTISIRLVTRSWSMKHSYASISATNILSVRKSDSATSKPCLIGRTMLILKLLGSLRTPRIMDCKNPRSPKCIFPRH
jgi:hypothetical protein